MCIKPPRKKCVGSDSHKEQSAQGCRVLSQAFRCVCYYTVCVVLRKTVRIRCCIIMHLSLLTQTWQRMYGYVQALCCAMGSSGWVLGKNYSLLSGDALAQATQEGDGITNPADIQELWRCGTGRTWLVCMVRMRWGWIWWLQWFLFPTLINNSQYSTSNEDFCYQSEPQYVF